MATINKAIYGLTKLLFFFYYCLLLDICFFYIYSPIYLLEGSCFADLLVWDWLGKDFREELTTMLMPLDGRVWLAILLEIYYNYII